MTIGRIPPWNINSWLMRECGLTARQSSIARRDSIERCKPKSYEEIKEQSKVSEAQKPEGTPPPKAEEPVSPAQSEGTFEDFLQTPPQEAGNAEAGEETCVTCKRPLGENCDCKIRLVSDIPF